MHGIVLQGPTWFLFIRACAYISSIKSMGFKHALLWQEHVPTWFTISASGESVWKLAEGGLGISVALKESVQYFQMEMGSVAFALYT